MKLFLQLLLATAAVVSLARCNIVLKPSKTAGLQAGYIFVQTCNVSARYYTKYAQQLQEKFNGSLWIVLTEFSQDHPRPNLANSVMSSAYQQLKQAGFSYTSETPFFFGGHSLGGIVVQDYLLDSESFPFAMKGLFLKSSFISRRNIDKINKKNWFLLTIGAELDGLGRLTRIAENYHNIRGETKLTLVLPGVNHYQFAGEGNPPKVVVRNDIKSEISNDAAHDLITNSVKSYMHVALEIDSDADRTILSDYFARTKYMLDPIVSALKYEGFYHFTPPCSKSPKAKPPNCLESSPWTTDISMLEMSGLDKSSLIINDKLTSVLGIPEPFPSINNKCTFESNENCVLNVSTVTQNMYNHLDEIFDFGSFPNAANELKTKMKSRQSILEAYTGKKFDFNQTDVTDRCGEINSLALNYALKAVPKEQLIRYLSKGVQLVIGPDIIENSGPTWILSSLKFIKKIDPKSNETFVELRAPSLRTSTSSKIVPGAHYCTLLSPARAVEWIYIDGLKPSM